MSMFRCELESIESKSFGSRPDNCTTKYVKITIGPDEDLDFEIKYRYGDVKYHIRRVLHYMMDTGRTELGGILRVMEPRDVYEVEIYKENKE